MDEPPMPDLSHLSAEEREIIEQVLRRQRDEEAKETQISQRADEELEQIEKQINERKENARRLVGTQDDVICQICQKTKFADGIGHKCFYCNLRSCARCGGRAQSKNKAIWACSLCQKKQQILAKTGKWFRGEEPKPPQQTTPTPSISANLNQEATPSPVPCQSQASTSSRVILPPTANNKINQDIRPIDSSSPRVTSEPMPTVSTENGSVMRSTTRQSSQQGQSFGMNDERHRQRTAPDDRRIQQRREEKPQQQPTANFFTPNEQPEALRNGTTQNYSRSSPPLARDRVSVSGPSIVANSQRTDESMNRPVPSERNPEFRRTRSIKEDDRRGSIGVRMDQNAVIQPIPQINNTTNQHRPKKNRLHRQIRSMSSSEDEVPSTSEGIALNEEARQRLPNECTSERGLYLLRYIYGGEKIKNGRKTGTIAGYSQEAPKPSRSVAPTVIPGEILAAKIRTYLSHPVTWQPSADQRRLIGHMVLHPSATGDFGLKVVGGRRSDTGRLGAFITKVKPGSVADTVGRLKQGDEVLEWNGIPLQNCTYDQVIEVVSASKHEQSQVELIVSRSASVPGGDDFLQVYQPHAPIRHLPHPQFVQEAEVSPSMSPLRQYPPPLTHSQSAFLHGSPRHKVSYGGYYPDVIEPSYGRGHIFGKIELTLSYSHVDRQLAVGVERAFDLAPRPDGIPRNPYAKLFLLPDRSEQSRRQTAVLAEANNPVWQETFYYHGISEMSLMERALEVTVWDYDKLDANAFLGEVLVDFRTVQLDGQPLVFVLADMDDDNPLRMRVRQRRHQGPSRPRSEMTMYAPPPKHDAYDVFAPNEAAMRRSRTYDRSAYGRGTPLADEDWHVQPPSGYLSDHAQPMMPLRPRHQRRPRIAASEMGASRPYRHQTWEEQDEPQEQRYPQHDLRDPREMRDPRDPRSPNGRMLMETMQEQVGYGSDGSETTSVRSAHSPLIRTINRRPPPVTVPQEMEEVMIDDSQQKQNMKERKKSLMTRFIPGRAGAGADVKRTGFARSEEVGIPLNLSADRLQSTIMKQTSKESTDSGDNWLPILPDQPLGTFVDNLGPGQVVGRQVLASPVLGEIQLAIMGGRGGIEVEIIMARNLVVKPGTKTAPAPYVKVYLMQDKLCVAKAKTNPTVRSTNPLFQQKLVFNENPKHKQLQVTVLGDYGRMERKAFMGIAQINLDKLQLGAQPVVGWYKLYHSSSLAGTGPVRKDSDVSLTGAA